MIRKFTRSRKNAFLQHEAVLMGAFQCLSRLGKCSILIYRQMRLLEDVLAGLVGYLNFSFLSDFYSLHSCAISTSCASISVTRVSDSLTASSTSEHLWPTVSTTDIQRLSAALEREYQYGIHSHMEYVGLHGFCTGLGLCSFAANRKLATTALPWGLVMRNRPAIEIRR